MKGIFCYVRSPGSNTKDVANKKAAIQEHINSNVRAWSNRVRGKCCVFGSYRRGNVTSSKDTYTHSRTKRDDQLCRGRTNCIDRGGRMRRGLPLRNLAMVCCRLDRNRETRKRLTCMPSARRNTRVLHFVEVLVRYLWRNRHKNSRTRRLRGKTWCQQPGLNR